MNTLSQATAADREAIAEAANPLGLDGIEFIEYSTTRPQALGQALEMMGFRPVARHRPRMAKRRSATCIRSSASTSP